MEVIDMERYNDYPNFMYAGFWIRFFAYCVDLIMIASVTRILTFWMAEGLVFVATGIILYLTYFVLMTKLNKGQTLGKMIFGIRVICFTEENLSWQTIIVRELFGRLFQKTLWIMYALVGFTPKKQHVVDLLCDTSVVTENYLLLYKNEESPLE
jgi:uncharacterized RDD family membrane protein YckC